MVKRYHSPSISDRRADWAQKIAAAWQKSVDAIFEVGDLLVAAKGELEHGEFGKMVEHELPFGDRTAERLMTIARDARLRNPTRGSLLPPCWRTLYEISRLTDAELNDAIADGEITPETERSQIEAIIARRTSPKVLKVRSSPAAVEKVAIEVQSLPAASEEVVVSFPADTSSDDDVAKTLIAAVLAGHANRQAGQQAGQRVFDLLTGPLSANRMEFVAEIGALYAQLVDVGGLH